MYNPQLETFLRVADAGSFSRAAEEAYITPTAVIKQINLLEESLGVKLFDRTHRGLTLTKAGAACIRTQNTSFNTAGIRWRARKTPCWRIPTSSASARRP